VLALRSGMDHRKIRLDRRPLLIAEPEIVRHESSPPDELESRQDVQFNWVQTIVHERQQNILPKYTTVTEPRAPRFSGRCVVVSYNGAWTHLSLNKNAPGPRAVQTVGRGFPAPSLGGLHHQYVRI
jgi:hypothetical protein